MSIKKPPRTSKLMLLAGACLLLLMATPALAVTTWNVGDLFLGVDNGEYQVRDQAGVLKETLITGRGSFTTGCAFDANDNLYVTEFGANNVSVFDGPNAPHTNNLFGGGYSTPEMVAIDAAGNVYIGNLGDGIHQYTSAGVFVKKIIAGTRVDFFDIAADQDTILFGQEGDSVLTASISTGLQGADFSTGTATQAFSMRILPDGGLLLADLINVKRYDATGTVIETYDVTGENSWFSMNLDPDGTSFWAGNFSTDNYYKFDIATGGVDSDIAGPFSTGAGGNLFGMCLLGEPTAVGGDPFRKELTSGPDVDEDGEIDIAIEVGQLITTEYDFTMTYSNLGGPPVLIVDTAPAEWIVTKVGGESVDVDECGDFVTVSNGFGEADVFKNGKPGKKCRSSTKILWTPDPDGGSINVVMETRQSPGKKNVKFAPTSCGPLFLNSGPAKVFEVDPATGEPLRDPVTGELLPPLFTVEPLVLVAVEDLDGGGIVPDGSGNEDGDALTDIEDVLHGFDPCSVGTGILYAGTDVVEFDGLSVEEERMAATPVVGGVPGVTVLTPTDDFVNGLAPTGAGTLFSGSPFLSDHNEITVAGVTLSTVAGPLPTGLCCNEDLAFDGTHVWRAHWQQGPLFKYLPDGTLVDSFAQTDVIGATFVWPADQLWISKWGPRQVGTFDPDTNTFTPVFGTTTNAGGLAYDIERGILWVGEQGGLVSAYDLTGGGAVFIVGSDHQPFGAIGDTVDGLAFIAD